MEMYAYCLTNYGLTLSQAQFDAMMERVEALGKVYADPLGELSSRMANVGRRLRAADSGPQTQQAEREIVALIEDLIKTAEERQSGGQSGSQADRSSRQAGQQGGRPRPSIGGVPRGSGQPSSPAQRSVLVPGPVERPTRLSKVRSSAESGDWADLPPRERQRIEQIRDRIMSERHRDLIGEYRTRLAEDASR
jgi:hypothetical protein